MSLSRFNVIAARARAKLVVLVSQEVIGHLAHDVHVLRDSRLLKLYAEGFAATTTALEVRGLMLTSL